MITLDADVYDTLEFVAEYFGGIGSGMYYERDGVPYCAVGMLRFADEAWGEAERMARQAIKAVGDTALGTLNDHAVLEVNRRRFGVASHARVSFADWCKELNVVRGAS